MDSLRPTLLAALPAAALAAAPALAADAAPGATETPAGPAPQAQPEAVYKKLSNESTLSRWAYTNLALKLRKSPSSSSRSVGRLRFKTEDGPPEVYLALRMYTSAAGRQWVEVRIPGRPNGRTGWVPREGLGQFRLTRKQLVIDRRRLRITLFNRGRRMFSARIGIGARATPTPAGRYWIRERLKGFGGVYGPLAFGTGAYSKLSEWPGGGVIGIHGTNQPELIPGRPSHGCVRLKNPNILRLDRLLAIGTPLLIK